MSGGYGHTRHHLLATEKHDKAEDAALDHACN